MAAFRAVHSRWRNTVGLAYDGGTSAASRCESWVVLIPSAKGLGRVVLRTSPHFCPPIDAFSK